MIVNVTFAILVLPPRIIVFKFILIFLLTHYFFFTTKLISNRMTFFIEIHCKIFTLSCNYPKVSNFCIFFSLLIFLLLVNWVKGSFCI